MGASDVGGKCQFYIAVDLTPDTISQWSPERIAAWFDGVAQVVRASEDAAKVEISTAADQQDAGELNQEEKDVPKPI